MRCSSNLLGRTMIVLLLMPSLVLASGFKLSGVGPVGLSIGGGGANAFITDWSSIYWNPAALAYSRPHTANIGLTNVLPFSEYQPQTGILGYDGPYSMREKVRTKYQEFLIPSLGFTFGSVGPLDGTGFALFVPFGLGTSYDLYDPPIGYYLSYDPDSFAPPQFPKYDWESSIQVVAAWVGVAKEVSNGLSIGLAAGPTFASMKFRKVKFIDPALIDTQAARLPIQYRLFPIDTYIEGKSTSFGLGFGIRYEPVEKLTIGFSGHYYLPVELSGDATAALYLPRNDTLVSMAGDDPNVALMFSGRVMESRGTFDATFKLPYDISLGLAYEVSPKLLIGLGAEYTFHSVFDIVEAEFEDLSIMEQPIERDTIKAYWKNTLKLSAGAQWDLGGAHLRFGVYYEGSPIPDSTFTPLIPDTGDKLSFNIGSDLQITRNLTLFAHYEYIYMPDKEVARDANYSYLSPNMPGKYAANVNAVTLGLGYAF